jgi:small subunit ribosomal protein S16
MVRIRLARAGKKNDIFYRIVVADRKKKNTGATLAVLGFWYPKKGEKKIDQKAYVKWLKLGAQPSEKVRELVSKK